MLDNVRNDSFDKLLKRFRFEEDVWYNSCGGLMYEWVTFFFNFLQLSIKNSIVKYQWKGDSDVGICMEILSKLYLIQSMMNERRSQCLIYVREICFLSTVERFYLKPPNLVYIIIGPSRNS